MRTIRILIAFGLVALVAAFVGCSDDSNILDSNNLTPDQQAVANLINLSSEFEHDVVSHTVPDTTATLAAGGAAPEGRFWWRTYTSSSRQLTIDTRPADSINQYAWSDVTVITTFVGTFHVVHRDTLGVYTHTTQAISDLFTQNARFEQWFSESSPNRGWVRTRLSNILGGSNPSTLDLRTLSIDPAVNKDFLYVSANFMVLYDSANKLILDENEAVNLWAESGTGSNRLFRHDWATGTSVREELTNQDLGYYSNSLSTPTSLTEK